MKSYTRRFGYGKERETLRETKSLLILIAAQTNVMSTNYVKAKIDKTQQISKWSFNGDSDESINHIISECGELAQTEYKSRYDRVGMVIHWELCKILKFDHLIEPWDAQTSLGLCNTNGLPNLGLTTWPSDSLKKKKKKKKKNTVWK